MMAAGRHLPPSIAGLTRVKTLNLHGSNRSATPPQIGCTTRLASFHPDTSRRLHRFSHEITAAARRENRRSARVTSTATWAPRSGSESSL